MSRAAAASDTNAYLARHARHVDDALERALARRADLLPRDVADAARHGVLGGGKRLRPVLCVSAYDACGGAVDARAYDLGAALELVHAYSLMHDDLPCMDDAPLRRGRPTAHVAHGEDATVRAGAALIPLAALQALEAARALGCPEPRARLVARALLEGAGAAGMVGGQWLDLLGEDRRLDAARLDDLHRRKTGALLTASLSMGALAAGADDAVRTALEAYGRAIGLAFQIADDVLDATQSAETLGKNPSDSALGKSTYVSLHGLDEAGRLADAEAARAVAALERVGLGAHPLAGLARFVVRRTS